MKHHNFYLKRLFSLSCLVTCSILLWFYGEQIKLSSYQPFIQAENRSYLITFMLLAWVLKFLFFDLENYLRTVTTKISPDLEKKLKILQGRWQGACEFLKKTAITKEEKKIRLNQLPWHILIGPSNSGKTSLLAHAGINYILAKQIKQKNITDEQLNHCDWWVTRDNTILDIPGTYLETDHTAQNSHELVLWKSLLDLIKRARGRQGIDGVIIAIPFAELLGPNLQGQLQEVMRLLQLRLAELTAAFHSQLPITVVVTKCDLLPGFLDYFKDSGSDELAQAWGITFTPLKPDEKPVGRFVHRFNMLIQRINQQLIWRLHQERNTAVRPLIKDFPLHLEQLKDALANFIKNITTAHPQLFVHGVYLTSATQHAPKEKPAHQPFIINSKHTENGIQLYKLPQQPTRAYFLKQLFLHGLASPLQSKIFPLHTWVQRAVYATSVILVAAAGFTLSTDFKASVKKTYAIQNQLTQYQINARHSNDPYDHLAKLIPLLDILQKTGHFGNFHGFNITQVLSFYSYKTTQVANHFYQHILENIVVPELKNYFAQYLQNPNNKNSGQLYAVLKSYLMLNDTKHANTEFIINTFLQISQKRALPAALTQHLNAAIQGKQLKQALNLSLVDQTRQIFINLANVDLASIILSNMGDNNLDAQINLGTLKDDDHTFITRGITTQIPRMFTAPAFAKILAHQIHQAAEEAVHGNWVLGNEAAKNEDVDSVATVSEQLRSIYITRYIDLWESLLANTHLNKPKNFSESHNQIKHLISGQSPLLLLLQTLNTNTHFSPILAISPKIKNLDMLLTNANNEKTDGLYPVFVSLGILNAYLQHIEQSADKPRAAFLAAAKRMQENNPLTDPITQLKTIAETSPEPIKTWLQDIAHNSWFFILQEAGNYLDVAWKNDVYSIYQTQIANRYPIADHAEQEIDLSQFTNFFGEPGIVSHFYLTYLQPFINTANKNKKWQWKVLDEEKIPLADDALAQIQRALQIQRVFFPNGDNKLYIPFTLQPVMLGKDTKDFKLNINGQKIEYNKSTIITPQTFAWPGNHPTQATTVQWVAANNQATDKTIEGSWAWFKLINQVTQGPISDKQLLLDFSEGNYTAKYLLTIPGSLNPFLLTDLQHFYLPQQVFASTMSS